MRTNRRVATLFVAMATVIGTGALAVPAGASAAKTPKITVTPSMGLKPGQSVTVSGTGFDAKADINGAECERGTSDPFTCQSGSVVDLESDAHGNFTLTLAVYRTLLEQSGLHDCGLKGCELLFAETDAPTVAVADIAFDPKAPLPKTTLTVTPSTKLKNDQSVRVAGTGFDDPKIPDEFVEVSECIASDFQCTFDLGSEPVEVTNGRFSMRMPLPREIFDTNTQTRVDCARTPTTCEVVAFDVFDVDYHATASIAFDPKLPPPPPPSVAVKPHTNLPYYARVALAGKNFSPDGFVILQECAGSDGFTCAVIGEGFTDAHGHLTGSPMVEREVPSEFDPGGATTDCVTVSGGCSLQVLDLEGGGELNVRLGFDPNAPIRPPPSATATPAPPYADGQTVHVKGKHFAPDAAFAVEECATKSTAHETETDCGDLGDTVQQTSGSGALSTAVQVARKIDDGIGDDLDCSAAHVQCTLEVSSEGGAEVVLPLSFTASTVAGAKVLQATRMSSPRRDGWFAAATARSFLGRAASYRSMLSRVRG